MTPYKELWWPRFWPFLRVVDDLPATKRGRRKASNYGVSIVIRRDVLENEPHVLQQEIYESRYWVTHFWRLVDFFWFYCMKPRQWFDGDKMFTDRLDWRWKRWKKAAAHLARVECASRAQEIRARFTMTKYPFYAAQYESWHEKQAHDYARSIHGASNYPFFKAAGWTEEDCYNEIVRNL